MARIIGPVAKQIDLPSRESTLRQNFPMRTPLVPYSVYNFKTNFMTITRHLLALSLRITRREMKHSKKKKEWRDVYVEMQMRDLCVYGCW